MVVSSTWESSMYPQYPSVDLSCGYGDFDQFVNPLDSTITQYGKTLEQNPALIDFSSSSLAFGPPTGSLGPALTIPSYPSASLSPGGNPKPNDVDFHPPPTPLPTFHNRKRPKGYITRPPNAFLLYRSDFLKKGKIPKEAESRQQNLSRVVAECWKRLDTKEREYWYNLAKEKAEEHAKKFPDYVYQPVRRGCVSKRRQRETKEETEVHCEELRKTYLPETNKVSLAKSPEPSKKRKARAKKKVEPKLEAIALGSLDSSLPAISLADPALTGPLIAPSDSDQHTLEAFHQTAIQEVSSSENLHYPEQEFSNDQFSTYHDEYGSTLGSGDIAHAGFQIPKLSPAIATAASQLQARFIHDKAAGMATTTAMFDAQYVDPSGFNVQPQFLPPVQPQTQPSLSDTVYFSTDMFERFVGTASYAQFLQPAFHSSGSMAHVNRATNLPVVIQVLEGPLVGPHLNSMEGDDTFDRFNLSNNLEGNVSSQLEWFNNYVPSYTSG